MTSVHSCQPSSLPTWSTRGLSPGTIGFRFSANRWPGTPSEIPMISSSTVSAFTAVAVPPIVKAATELIFGEAP